MALDARVRYTKMAIRDAFLTLLREKSVKQITVTELCALAEINRATFYKHYQDAFDLLEQIELGMLDHLRETAGGGRGGMVEKPERVADLIFRLSDAVMAV